MVAGTQEVFRLLLDILANPGRPINISNQVCQFAANGRWLAPALTLLDSECSFYWDGSEEEGEEIRFLTGATQVSPEKADFIFLSSIKINQTNDTEIMNILSKVKSGTHLDPHNSAMLIIATFGRPEHSLSLKGPGIPPEGRSTMVSSFEMSWIKARDAQRFEYPCGVEIVFLREDNSLLAITRKAAVRWPM
jgi:phosphonate C-P lyase system protein PhnH